MDLLLRYLEGKRAFSANHEECITSINVVNYLCEYYATWDCYYMSELLRIENDFWVDRLDEKDVNIQLPKIYQDQAYRAHQIHVICTTDLVPYSDSSHVALLLRELFCVSEWSKINFESMCNKRARQLYDPFFLQLTIDDAFTLAVLVRLKICKFVKDHIAPIWKQVMSEIIYTSQLVSRLPITLNRNTKSGPIYDKPITRVGDFAYKMPVTFESESENEFSNTGCSIGVNKIVESVIVPQKNLQPSSFTFINYPLTDSHMAEESKIELTELNFEDKHIYEKSDEDITACDNFDFTSLVNSLHIPNSAASNDSTAYNSRFSPSRTYLPVQHPSSHNVSPSSPYYNAPPSTYHFSPSREDTQNKIDNNTEQDYLFKGKLFEEIIYDTLSRSGVRSCKPMPSPLPSFAKNKMAEEEGREAEMRLKYSREFKFMTEKVLNHIHSLKMYPVTFSYPVCFKKPKKYVNESTRNTAKMVIGEIDAIWLKDNGYVVIMDFKTTNKNKKYPLLLNDVLQLLCYCLAFAEMTGIEKIIPAIYRVNLHTKTREFREIPFRYIYLFKKVYAAQTTDLMSVISGNNKKYVQYYRKIALLIEENYTLICSPETPVPNQDSTAMSSTLPIWHSNDQHIRRHKFIIDSDADVERIFEIQGPKASRRIDVEHPEFCQKHRSFYNIFLAVVNNIPVVLEVLNSIKTIIHHDLATNKTKSSATQPPIPRVSTLGTPYVVSWKYILRNIHAVRRFFEIYELEIENQNTSYDGDDCYYYNSTTKNSLNNNNEYESAGSKNYNSMYGNDDMKMNAPKESQESIVAQALMGFVRAEFGMRSQMCVRENQNNPIVNEPQNKIGRSVIATTYFGPDLNLLKIELDRVELMLKQYVPV